MTDPFSDAARSALLRRLATAAVLFGLVAAGWTAAWSFARNALVEEMDRRLDRLSAAGIEVVCPDRTMGGFPLRLELTCRDPGVEIAARGTGGSVALLKVGVAAWSPRDVVAEIEGPLVVERTGAGRVDARWRTAVATLHVGGGGPEELVFSLAGVDLRATGIDGRAGRLAAEHLSGRLAPSGGNLRDLDASLAAASASLEVDGRRIGPPRSDTTLDATLRDVLPPPAGDVLRAFAERGGRVDPLRLGWSAGGIRVAGRGTLILGRNGRVDGVVALAAQGLENLVTAGAALGPETASLVGGFALFGKASDDPDLPGRRLDLVIEDGRPRLGRVIMPQMRPLFAP